MSPGRLKGGTTDEDLEKPLTASELKSVRLMMHDIDNYMFAINLVRRVMLGFAVLVGVLYGGRDLIGRIWKAVIP